MIKYLFNDDNFYLKNKFIISSGCSPHGYSNAVFGATILDNSTCAHLTWAIDVVLNIC